MDVSEHLSRVYIHIKLTSLYEVDIKQRYFLVEFNRFELRDFLLLDRLCTYLYVGIYIYMCIYICVYVSVPLFIN